MAEIVNNHLKIIHKITRKFTTLIKATDGYLSHTNIQGILIQIMRDINKYKLKNIEKKQIATIIIGVLLDELGLPHIVSQYSSTVIVSMIENIYSAGLHRYKRPCKWRFWKS